MTLRPNSIFARGLKIHIDAGKSDQNGYGYNDFVRMMTVPTPPTFSAIGKLFNKDGQTISKWWDRYKMEQQNERLSN